MNGPMLRSFGSGHKYRNSVHLLTCIYYLETCRFHQHDDNSDFATLTTAIAAAADELFRLTIILRQKMARNIAKGIVILSLCVIFNQTTDYLYISDI